MQKARVTFSNIEDSNQDIIFDFTLDEKSDAVDYNLCYRENIDKTKPLGFPGQLAQLFVAALNTTDNTDGPDDFQADTYAVFDNEKTKIYS